MCIILYKPKFIELPNLEILENCFYNNPDGAGFMYQSNNKVVINKGHMELDRLITSLEQLQNITEMDLVIHFRLASHGRINKGNTHPFPISKSISQLTKINITTSKAIVHNGIIPFCNDPLRQYSDTQIFIKDYLTKIDITEPVIQELIQKSTNSKYIIMANNNVYMLGKFIFDNGIYYSNNSYTYNYYFDDITENDINNYNYNIFYKEV